MVEMATKVGPKGQVVIPKSLRDDYGMMPKDKVVFKETKEGVLILKPKKDASEIFRRIAFSKGNKTKIKKDYFAEQVEERLERAGINL